MSVESVITENIDIWTSAIKTKSASGRSSSNKLELYGIKKLRELILDLAIRGKLVSQNSDDEPASELFKKIEERKLQLIKDKKVKKAKSLPLISSDEIPFQLPSNWKWCRFSELLDFSGGGQPPKSFFSETMLDGYVQLIQIRDLGPNPQPVYIPKEKASKFCTKDDIMVGRYGASVGKVFWGKEGSYNVALVKIHNDFKAYTPSFIYLLLSSPLGQSFFGGISRSAQDGFNKNDIAPKLIPLLSFEEQNRIVAKVDELMLLCDQLESKTESSIEAHKTLVDTLLATLTNAKDADELNESWQRISEHFDTLFTTEDSIDQLKQTILQLAVMGKLVKQDPNDEPVEGLLDRIFEEQKNNSPTKKELNILEQEYLNAKSSVSGNRVQVKARFICNFITKGTTPSKNELLENGPVPFLKVYNIVNNEIDFEYRPIFISEDVHTGKLKRSIALPGDVLMNIVGPPLGKVAVLPDSYPSWNMNQALAVFKPQGGVLPEYLYYVLPTDTVLSSVLKEVKGTAGQDNLSLEQCRDLLIPLPSINEQKRIVEKIKALSSICDQLKASIRKSLSIKHCLADSVSSSLVN